MSPISRAAGILNQAVVGAIIGCLSGGVIGYCLGVLAGGVNERTLTSEEMADLHLGYAQYAASSVSFFTTLLCCVAGGIGGFGGSIFVGLRRSAWIGVLVSASVVGISILVYGARNGHGRHWRETQFVVLIGGAISASIGTILTRSLQKQEGPESLSEQVHVELETPNRPSSTTWEQIPDSRASRWSSYAEHRRG